MPRLLLLLPKLWLFSPMMQPEPGGRPGPAPWSHCRSSAGAFCCSILQSDAVHCPVQAGLSSGSEGAWLPSLWLWGEQSRACYTLLFGEAR